MIISFNGDAGAGKSTIAKKLAEKLGWSRYYIGGIRRQKAKERGMTLAEYNKLGETDPSTDLEVDKYQEGLGEKKDNFVIEGRTSWHFIPHSLKIYLEVDKREGAQRIFNQLSKQADNNRNEGSGLDSVEKVLESNKRRLKSDNKRYKKYFNIDVHNKKHYNIIVNTTNLSEKEVLEAVYDKIKDKLDA
ncbi:cytidylate kinase family protein [bacterium]|nr:cytidylate kinase family protein [bacterium]